MYSKECSASLEKTNKQTNITPTKKKLIASLVVICLVVILSIVFFGDNDGKFAKVAANLYMSQTELHKAIGQPSSSNESAGTIEGNPFAADYYNDISFLGEKGDATVIYDPNSGTEIDEYCFCYKYRNETPTDTDKDRAQNYSSKVIDYFEKVYGIADRIDDDEASWSLHDYQTPTGKMLQDLYVHVQINVDDDYMPVFVTIRMK